MADGKTVYDGGDTGIGLETNMRLGLLVMFLALTGCQDEIPAYVYVPGKDAKETVIVSASTLKGKVNEPVILHATRETTGFIRVKYSTLSDPRNYWRKEPPAFEQEVAGNLRWIIDPSGAHFMNLDYRIDQTREVIFKKAGKYRLYGFSAVYIPPNTRSNTIEIEIIAD